MQTSKTLRSIGEDNMINKKLSIVSEFMLKLVVLPMIIFTMVSCVKGTPSVDNDTNAPSIDEDNNTPSIDEDSNTPSIDEDSNTFKVKGMVDINTIESNAYNLLFSNDKKVSWVGYYPLEGNGTPLSGSVQLNSDASSFKFKTINTVKNSGFIANFLFSGTQLENLYIDQTTVFTAYLTDSRGNIIQEPTGSIGYSILTKNANIKVTDLTGVNPYSDPTLEGQEINLLIAYDGTNGKKYYIRYPLSFKYTG